MMSNKINFRSLLLVGITFIFTCVSCGKKGNYENEDTPTSGTISIAVDESLKLLFESQVHTFQSIYTNAKLHVYYLPEQEAIDYLLKDSVRIAIVTRKLTKEETAILSKVKIQPHEIKVAVDAITAIVNRKNIDSLLTLDQLQLILKGDIQSWNKINSKNKLGELNVVFDHANSSTLRFIKDSILSNPSTLGKNVFALKTNPEVIDYVKNNIHALGIIGVSWISDPDDTTTFTFLKNVRIVGIAEKNQNEYVKPYQAYIAQKTYSLTRSIYMISREPRAGLGSGFIAFVSSDKGQRIVLKSGLLPATMPIRIVDINHEELK